MAKISDVGDVNAYHWAQIESVIAVKLSANDDLDGELFLQLLRYVVSHTVRRRGVRLG